MDTETMITAVSQTTTRRAALRGTFATIIASAVTAPAIATSSPDARLIALCGQLDALQDDFAELFGRCVTIEQEHATEPEMDALHAREDALMAQIEAAGPPTTMVGIVAVARAGLAMHPHRDTDGTAIAGDDNHWLLLLACEARTGNA